MIGMITALYLCYAYIFAGNGLTLEEGAVLSLAIVLEVFFEGVLVIFLQIRKEWR